MPTINNNDLILVFVIRATSLPIPVRVGVISSLAAVFDKLVQDLANPSREAKSCECPGRYAWLVPTCEQGTLQFMGSSHPLASLTSFVAQSNISSSSIEISDIPPFKLLIIRYLPGSSKSPASNL